MAPRIGMRLNLEDEGEDYKHVDQVQRMERLGYDSVWIGETTARDVFGLLSHLAHNTTTITLGSAIANIFSRTPSQLAMAAATLDETSGGRFNLGLGTSGAKLIQDWHGVPFKKPVKRSGEYIKIIKLILSGQRVNYDGEFFKLRDFKLTFEPRRRNLPIYICALGPKYIELTGELADGWVPIYLSPRHHARMVGVMQVGATRTGRNAKEQVDLRPYTMTCVANGENLEQCKYLVRGHLSSYIGGSGYSYHALVSSFGYKEECDLMREAWQRRDRAGAVKYVTDAMVDDLAVVGTAEQCRQKLMDIRSKTGVSPIIYVARGVRTIDDGPPANILKDTIEGVAPVAFK